MSFLTNTKKTRFKLAVVGAAFMGGITITAIVYDMNDVAGSAIAGFLTILSSYILGDSYRKSTK